MEGWRVFCNLLDSWMGKGGLCISIVMIFIYRGLFDWFMLYAWPWGQAVS